MNEIEQSVADQVTHTDSDEAVLSMWLHGKAKLTQEAYEREAPTLLVSTSKRLREITLADLQAYQTSLQPPEAVIASDQDRHHQVAAYLAAKVNATPTNVAVMLNTPRINSRLTDRIVEEDDMLRIIDLEKTRATTYFCTCCICQAVV